MQAVAIEPQQQPASLHTAGELIDGKYQLERELGAGAMGRVWLARNTMLDLPVAIKVVDLQHHGREAVARVLTEARLLAQLSHPNIVRVLDCHSDKDAAYVVMELLSGCTLGELMEEGPLSPALVVRMMVPLLDALCSAHSAGIVHRDIKPDNIFIARRGDRICPKLLDFGIAHSDDAWSVHRDKRLIVGTPGYMAPEQALGEDRVDQRADIWAIGVVMYEAISGSSAFRSSSYGSYLRALREHKLAPLDGESALGLWLVLERAMARAPEARYASAAELAGTLCLWLRARGLREDLKGDSLPKHWAAQGGVIDRAFRRSDGRAVGDRSERRRVLPGSATLVDPRAPGQPGSRRTHRRADRPAKRAYVLGAAVAAVLCAGLMLLQAHADAGDASQSRSPHVTPIGQRSAPPTAASSASQGVAAPSETNALQTQQAPAAELGRTPAAYSGNASGGLLVPLNDRVFVW